MFVADQSYQSALDEISPPTLAGTPSPLTGTSAQAVSATLSGLTPDSFYFYRAVAFGGGDTVLGPLRAFNTQIATSFSGLANNLTSITYGTGSVPLSGQVVANPSLPLLAGSEVSVSINGLSEATPVNPDGTFQLPYQFATPPGVGQSPLTITYSFLDPNGVFASASDSSQTLSVTPATANVSLNPVNLTYGTALANGQLSGSATWTVDGLTVTVPGEYSYTTPGTVLGAGNGQAESVTFTPSDMTDYSALSATVLVNVAQATPTVSVAGPPTSVFGQPVTFTATVAATDAGTPTGSVAFYDGPTLIGTATLGGGTASVSTGTLAVGAPAITVDYLGDANFTVGWSYGFALSVGHDDTSLTVTTSGRPAPFGQPVTFTASVAPAAPGAIAPTTGAVQFKIDGKAAGSPVALNAAGMASYTVSTLAIGTHTVSATYADSAGDYNGSNGALAPAQTIGATTQTALTSSTSAAVYSEAVTFTATVATADTTATPTGSVKFYVDGVLAKTVALSGGTASYATSALAAASSPHAVYATYVPSGLFLGSTSVSQSVAVSQATTTTSVTSHWPRPTCDPEPVLTMPCCRRHVARDGRPDRPGAVLPQRRGHRLENRRLRRRWRGEPERGEPAGRRSRDHRELCGDCQHRGQLVRRARVGDHQPGADVDHAQPGAGRHDLWYAHYALRERHEH